MESTLLRQFSDQLHRDRHALVNEIADDDKDLQSMTQTGREEFEERAQRERDSFVLERLDERSRARVREIDAALARIEAGTFGKCVNCDNPIPEEALRLDPTVWVCPQCLEEQSQSKTEESGQPAQDFGLPPSRGELPPDLANLSDQEVEEYLRDLVRNDGRIDGQELTIHACNGVAYLEGSLPSEAEHQTLRNILTDVAGIQDIIDHIEIDRLAWERSDRSKEESACEIPPGTMLSPAGALRRYRRYNPVMHTISSAPCRFKFSVRKVLGF